MPPSTSRTRSRHRRNGSRDRNVSRSRIRPRSYARSTSSNDSDHVTRRSRRRCRKLDSGMRGLYKVVNILPRGRYELKLVTGDWRKTTQAADQYIVRWRGEWCPEACAAFFDYDTDEAVGSPVLGPSNHGQAVEDNAASGEAVLEISSVMA